MESLIKENTIWQNKSDLSHVSRFMELNIAVS